jgi:hypothetical protein
VAKTVPTTASPQSPDLVRPGRHSFTVEAQDTIEFGNFVYGRVLRQNILHFDARELGLGDGIYQGTGSTIDSTADGSTYVERLRGYYVARMIPDDHDLIKVRTVAEADTATGGIKVKFEEIGGGGGNDETVTHSIATGSLDEKETTLGGGALDGDLAYYVIVTIMAGTSGWTKLYNLDVAEINIAFGSMP